jgi:hydroxymethylglutaryl-CoA lyase
MTRFITLLETPRDALQGLPRPVPTAEKIAYLEALLACGFKVLDFGSFVSPKAVPQMADSAEVFKAIAPLARRHGTELLAIIANARGLETGLQLGVKQFGFPFSISDEFQRRNTGKSIDETWPLITAMGETARAANARLVIYLSMAFGNPYHETFTPQILTDFARRCADAGFTELSLADTVGAASPSLAAALVGNVSRALPEATLGVHFHCRPDQVAQMAAAALDGGVSWFDCALGGVGGCPFAQDKLVGNMATPALVEFLQSEGYETGINSAALQSANRMALELAGKYGSGAA